MSASLAIVIVGSVIRLIVAAFSWALIFSDYEYDKINMFPIKSTLQHPISYFKVDNGSNPIEKNHNEKECIQLKTLSVEIMMENIVS